MKIIKNTIFGLFLFCVFILPGIIRADYQMMCTFFDNPVARIFTMSEEGDIAFDHYLDVGGNPITIEFSPNGKWGMIGSNTTYYPPTQKTIILGVDSNRNVSVLGTVHNEHYDLVAISPDSRYGIFGNYLQTVIFNNSDNSFYTNTENNTFNASFYANFSSLNKKIISRRISCLIKEYDINSNGRVVETGESLDISPSSGNEDLRVSPDGKTCVILSIGDYHITVLRIHRGGGFTIAQQFNTESLNPAEVRFTPDSRYAIIAFITAYPDLRIYRINWDSTLTETDNIYLPNVPGWKMAVTPDGKFAVTVALINTKTYFYIVRIHEDGTLEYLPEKDYNCNSFVGAIAFVPPEITSTGNSWVMYE